MLTELNGLTRALSSAVISRTKRAYSEASELRRFVRRSRHEACDGRAMELDAPDVQFPLQFLAGSVW